MTEPAAPDARDPGADGPDVRDVRDGPDGTEASPAPGLAAPGRAGSTSGEGRSPNRPLRASAPGGRPASGGRPGTAARQRSAADDPGAPADAPVRRPPNLLGIVIVATALLVAFVVTTGIFLPAIGELGRLGSHDPGALPATLSVCSRTYRLAEGTPARTHDEIVERDGQEPVVVSTGPFIGCPAEVRPDGPAGALSTVVYVRTGEDAYRAYELAGGP